MSRYAFRLDVNDDESEFALRFLKDDIVIKERVDFSSNDMAYSFGEFFNDCVKNVDTRYDELKIDVRYEFITGAQ